MTSTSDQRAHIEAVIVDVIRTMNLARKPEFRLEESPTAALYGGPSPLDSLGLVSLLIEIEESLRDLGCEVSLSDERAISQKNSPFRNVPTLVAYIQSQLPPGAL